MNFQNAFIASGIIIAGMVSLYFTYSPPRVTHVHLLLDLTDSLLSKPDTREVGSLYDFSTNPWNGGSFKAKSITDMDYNRSYVIEIPSADFTGRLASNEIERKKVVEAFVAGQDAIVDSIMRNNVGRSHSSVYRVIAGELNELSEKDVSHRRILLVYGDIRENSEFLNLYDPAQLSLLKSNPDSIVKLFQHEIGLRDLSVVEVYFIYEPPSYHEAEPYRLISEVYRRMLEEKGAVVHVVANFSIVN